MAEAPRSGLLSAGFAGIGVDVFLPGFLLDGDLIGHGVLVEAASGFAGVGPTLGLPPQATLCSSDPTRTRSGAAGL